MQIPNNSVASLFQQLQSLAGSALGDAGFGAQLTGQNLPSATSATASASLGASPLTASPSSQFASNILSTLLSAQEGSSSPQTLASQIISAINPNGNGSLSLGQVEQSLTGSSASASPQQMAIAGAFAQIDTNSDGALSQTELASALQSLQQSDPTQGLGGHRHHHHHHVEDASSTTESSTSASSTGSVTDATTTDGAAGAAVTPASTVSA